MNKNLKNLSKNLKFPSGARKFEIFWKIFEIFVQALPSTPFSIVYSRSPLPPMAQGAGPFGPGGWGAKVSYLRYLTLATPLKASPNSAEPVGTKIIFSRCFGIPWGMARLKPCRRGIARLEPWEGGVTGNKQWKNGNSARLEKTISKRSLKNLVPRPTFLRVV